MRTVKISQSERGLSMSRDGKKLVYPRMKDKIRLISLSETGGLLFRRSHREEHVYVTPIDPKTGQPTGEPVKLAAGYWPMWSPDGKRIAYFSGWNLHVMSADGSNDQKIIGVSPFIGTHAWAADSKHIYVAESSRVETEKGVYSISIATKERRPVYLDRDLVGHLSCSPDGTRLAFRRFHAPSKNKRAIFTVNVDGTNLKQLTSDKDGWVLYPAWSPDGKQIAFQSVVPGGGIKTLTAVSVDDGTSREIFRGKTPQDWFFEASWSPDGSKIVWNSRGEFRIGQVSDGSYERFKLNLGLSPKPEFGTPRWSPDGSKMLFFTASNFQYLMLMENFLPSVEDKQNQAGSQ